MKTRTIASFVEFCHAVKETQSFHPIFRGESSATYELLPKIGRFQKINTNNTSARETGVLDEFKLRAVPHISHRPKNDWEWLALAQHHGLATRLLDWTYNPLVAVYFCGRSRKFHQDWVIYCLDEYSLSHASQSDYPFQMKVDCIYKPPHLSQRFSAQSGLFTVHHSPTTVFDSSSLERWVIGKKCTIEMISFSRQFGATDANLFPDLDGLCKDLHENWVWRSRNIA